MKTNFNFDSDALVLSDLGPGELAVVESVAAPGPIGRRLLDLGFLPDTPVPHLLQPHAQFVAVQLP